MTPRRRNSISTRTLVYWALRALGPCADVELERVLWKQYRTKGPTVRGARKALERRGLVACVGRANDGRRTWDLSGVARRPRAKAGSQAELF